MKNIVKLKNLFRCQDFVDNIFTPVLLRSLEYVLRYLVLLQ